MRDSLNRGWTVIALALLVFAATTFAQSPINMKRSTGQTIVPVFEGWERNADGTASLVFGYMNRNYTQTISVPVGADNRFESGDGDRGQPTFFYPRRHEFLFRVAVPKDWGDKELIWALTVNGQTEKAYGSLKPVWELSRAVIVDNVHGNANINFAEQDRPPALKVEPVAPSVTLPARVTLSAAVSDSDGIPPPLKPKARGLAVGRTDEDPARTPFMNVPMAAAWRFPPGLSAGWFVYRGPSPVTFEPQGYHAVPPDGRVVTSAQFSQPGTYVLRAVASDSMLETIADITVVVAAAR